MAADPEMVYLLETAKGRLARALPGYRTSDVDSFFGEVLAAVRRGEPLSPEDFQFVTFRLSRWRVGYAPQDVDRLIGELAQLTADPASEGMPFKTVRVRPGYVMADVDSLLASVEQALADLAW